MPTPDFEAQAGILRLNVERLVDEKAELQRENERLRKELARLTGMGIQRNDPDAFDEVRGG